MKAGIYDRGPKAEALYTTATIAEMRRKSIPATAVSTESMLVDALSGHTISSKANWGIRSHEDMSGDPTRQLLIMIAHERADRLAQVTQVVTKLGHQVIDREIEILDVGPATVETRPDVAIVIVGSDSEPQALRSIDTIVKEAACPVIAILDVQDRAFINEAAKRGIFAYIADGKDPEELQSAIDIVLRRFAEYHDLEGAFGRRAVTERAKGILMERHGIDEQAAFNLLRDHARRNNRKMVDVAEEIMSTHRLLPGASQPAAPGRSDDPE
jgi:AmiR/NasT family two-component response regulator